jgi:hypothetical protein
MHLLHWKIAKHHDVILNAHGRCAMNTMNLQSISLAPGSIPNMTRLIIRSADNEENTFLLDQKAVDALLSSVIGYAGERWKERPETAFQSVAGIASAMSVPQGLSMELIDDQHCAVSLSFGDVGVAFLVPAAQA